MKLRTLPRSGLVGLVRAYRFWLKPWIGNVCRFEPSCSEYALQALQTHGAARGSVLTVGRLLRCHPWCDAGLDPVPNPDHLPGNGLFTRLLSTRRAEPSDARTLTRKIP